MTSSYRAERKRGGGPERMVTGAARDAMIDLFAERYPEDDPHAREVRDAADLADERCPAVRREVVSAFFSRKRGSR